MSGASYRRHTCLPCGGSRAEGEQSYGSVAPTSIIFGSGQIALGISRPSAASESHGRSVRVALKVFGKERLSGRGVLGVASIPPVPESPRLAAALAMAEAVTASGAPRLTGWLAISPTPLGV